MADLNLIDYIIIGFYFVSLISIGIYLQKFASKGLQDYVLGGRKIPWWALGFSGMEHWFDMAGTMIIVSFLYMMGPRGLFIEFRGGAVLALPFVMLWVGKWLRRSEVMTPAAHMIFRFGDGFGGRFAQIAAGFGNIVGTIGMLAYLIKASGLFLSMFIPVEPFTCALVMIIFATIYTMISGFYGVVFTDIFQSVFVVISVIVISIMAVAKIASVPDFLAMAEQVSGQSNWSSCLPHFTTNMPKGYEIYNNLFMFSFFYLLSSAFKGMGFRGDPKWFGARSTREAGKMSYLIMWLMALRWPLMISLAVLGVFLVNDMYPDQTVLTESAELIQEYMPDVTKPAWPTALSKIASSPGDYAPELIEGLKSGLGENWKNKLYLLSYEGTVNPERIVPAVLIFVVQRGMRGILLVALLAASMSTFDSQVNLAAGIITHDLYQKYFRPKSGEKELVYAAWTAVIILVVIAFLFAYTVESINDIWAWITIGFGTGLMVPGFLRFYWWRLNGSGFAIATIIGVVGAILHRIFGPMLADHYWLFKQLEDERFVFCTFLLIGLVGSILGSYLTKPTKHEVLSRFFIKTRPFGLWGPYKKLMTQQEQQGLRKEHKNDIISLFFVLPMQIALFMFSMVLVLQMWTAVTVTGVIVIIGAIGTYYFWYRNLPKEGQD